MMAIIWILVGMDLGILAMVALLGGENVVIDRKDLQKWLDEIAEQKKEN